MQDVEIPLDGTADFLRWFARRRRDDPGLAVPAAAARAGRPRISAGLAAVSAPAGRTYVNIGFWGSVPIAEGAADGDVNRAIERAVSESGGHKSLYSDAYYDRDGVRPALRRRRPGAR